MKRRVLLYGDSNTWGYISGSEDERYEDEARWSAHLAKRLGAGYTLIEEGYVGRTTVWTDPVEGRMSGLAYFGPCLESHMPLDLVLIMLGTNDLKTYFNNTAFDTATGVERLVALAQGSQAGRAGQPPAVLLVSPVHIAPHPGQPMFGESAAKKSRQLAAAYRQVAQRRGAGFLDAADYARPGEGDGLHIDPACFPALAAAFAQKIEEMLGTAEN